MAYTYNRGTWSDGNNLPEWGDNEDQSKYLERIGYSQLAYTFGSEDYHQIQIYDNESGDGYLADVTLGGGTVYNVYIADFPSLMMFIRDHGPAFSAENVNSSLEQMLILQQKFFRAEHGHDADQICKQCAPDEYENRLRARQARAESKSK